MAVAVVMQFKGGTLDQYDEVIAKMGFTPGGPGAPGGLLPPEFTFHPVHTYLTAG